MRVVLSSRGRRPSTLPEPHPQDSRDSDRRGALQERRARVVDAVVDLVLEGHLPPSAEEVARRADISLATLFRYFESLDQLRLDAAARTFLRFRNLFEVPEIGVGARDDRIRRFTETRVALWERVHLLARMLRSSALQDPGAADLVDLARRTMADQVRQHFELELRGLGAAQRDDAVATIASLSSVESWEQFRHASRRSPKQIRRAWAHAIDRVLPEPSPVPGRRTRDRRTR